MTATQRVSLPDLIEQLMSGYQKPDDLLGEHGLLKQLTKAVVEREALEITVPPHSYTPHSAPACPRL